MNARSAASRSKGRGKAPTQLTMGAVASSASSLLSSQPDSVTKLATGLSLGIDLHISGEKQWLELKLEDELNLAQATVNYPVICPTLQRGYHLRESVVIAMRRLMQQVFDQEMISDYPGELLTVLTPPPAPPAHMLMPSEEDFSPSSTDLESLLDSLSTDILQNM